MSKQPPNDQETLPPLPTHRSSDELDQRILARARARAPRKRSAHIPAWSAGLATAGVLVVAVLVTTPGQESLPVSGNAQQELAAPPAAPARVTADATMKMSSDDMSSKEAQKRAANSLPAPQAAADARSEQADLAQFNRIRFAETPGTAPTELLTPEALTRLLERQRELLNSGAEAQARTEYRQLQLDCPGCELPDSLEQAILAYLLED